MSFTEIPSAITGIPDERRRRLPGQQEQTEPNIQLVTLFRRHCSLVAHCVCGGLAHYLYWDNNALFNQDTLFFDLETCNAAGVLSSTASRVFAATAFV